MKLAQVNRIEIGNVPVDRVTFAEALDVIAEMVDRKRGGTVFTPNVDHVVMASEDDRFRDAYTNVDLSLADGMPVVWASKMLGVPVPEKVSGSDLAPALMTLAAARGYRVYLLGGAEGVAERAAERMTRMHDGLTVVGTASPRIDMGQPASARAAIVEAVKATNPDIVLVCLGAPKQELWIQEAAEALRPAVLLGVGASIDFLAGTARRAPRWMSSSGLEWLYRLGQEPRRLWRRYLVRDPKFAAIVMNQLLAGRAETQS